MTFFVRDDDLTEELTQRNLRSPRGKDSDLTEIILRLQRENLYLKNQLFSFVQDSGAYDMYLPCHSQLPTLNAKNGRTFTSPSRWQHEAEVFSPCSNRPQLQFRHQRQCFSPRVQSFNYQDRLHNFRRTRSPQCNSGVCRRLVINTNNLTKYPFRIMTNCPGMTTVRTSPTRMTPKQSIIFTTNPSTERNKSIFNEARSRETHEKLEKLKRNAKSPTFLKNRHGYKENVKESIIFGAPNNQLPKQQQKVNIQQFPLQIQNAPKRFEDLKPSDPNRTAPRRKSRTFTIQFSQGDSCLSIQCRLRQILYDSPLADKPSK